MVYLVTGGAGFVGSNFILQSISEDKVSVVNVDKLTGAGNLNNLSALEHHPSYSFVRSDIKNRTLIQETLKKHRPTLIAHFAAETSIDKPETCLQSNLFGTFELMEEVISYWRQLNPEEQKAFRFLYLSSDDVLGSSLEKTEEAKENASYSPSTIYGLTKASTEQLLMLHFKNYGIPVLIVRSPNNFGSFQFPDKLIPLAIVHALQGEPITFSGNGLSSRQWLHVDALCRALRLVASQGTPGEIYHIPGQAELTNKGLVAVVCKIMDELRPESTFKPHMQLMKFSKEKPNADQRFSLIGQKLGKLGWKQQESIEESLRQTVLWYLNNISWVEHVVSGEYRELIDTNFSAALV